MKSLGGLIEIAVWHFGAARRVLHSAERKKKKREMGESLTDLVNDICMTLVQVSVFNSM